ncbi:IclR family transcriptional regulator [Xanthobacter sp. TB0139]|uniref:IclR family transcriptional regulator n=1 Tax=Xanthobacter sp. TB0139 TaxID=3459178 RepID=UPI00403A65B0
MDHVVMDEDRRDGAQSIERTLRLMQLVGRAGPEGTRLADLVAHSGLPKPTVRRLLLALMRGGMVEQDHVSRRYFIGPEAYVLGIAASARFGIHALSLAGLSRLAIASEDSAFVSVRRDSFSVCLHCEEGAFPIRTQVLKAGDRHPLGVGGGSLAILAALPDEGVTQVLEQNAKLLRDEYPTYSPELLWRCVEETRNNGYAFNPGILMPGSWAIGIAVRDAQGLPIGALSIAAIESRLQEERRTELAPILRKEALILEAALQQPSTHSGEQQAHLRRAQLAALTHNRKTSK